MTFEIIVLLANNFPYIQDENLNNFKETGIFANIPAVLNYPFGASLNYKQHAFLNTVKVEIFTHFAAKWSGPKIKPREYYVKMCLRVQACCPRN